MRLKIKLGYNTAILASAVVTFLVAVSLILYAVYGYFSDAQRGQLRQQVNIVAQGVMHEQLNYFNGIELGRCRVTWINADGAVLYDSQEPAEEMENHLNRQEVQQALSGVSGGYGESERYSDTMLEKLIYCAKLLPDGTVLRLSVPQNTILALMREMALPIGIILLVVIALAVAVAAKETQKANEARAEALRREFTANVSHELKTPLHSIAGYAELLESGLVAKKDISAFAGKIRSEAQRMTSLVKDVILLSQLDEGNITEEKTTVDLYNLAESVCTELSSLAQHYQVRTELIGQPTEVSGVPQLLHAMLHNICENAIKYNYPGGKAVIEVKTVDGHPAVSVRDTGIGIPQEEQDRIFERFYRVDKSHSRSMGGTGLGLSIVKHAAMLHAAHIELESTVGKGTSIVVRFH